MTVSYCFTLIFTVGLFTWCLSESHVFLTDDFNEIIDRALKVGVEKVCCVHHFDEASCILIIAMTSGIAAVLICFKKVIVKFWDDRDFYSNSLANSCWRCLWVLISRTKPSFISLPDMDRAMRERREEQKKPHLHFKYTQHISRYTLSCWALLYMLKNCGASSQDADADIKHNINS